MLARGTRFGTYEILEPIGSGGSGEVFRAHDARLQRDVAIKVLGERSKLDSQRLRRLEHEARVLASLNHPNIATLHAIERVGDAQALVLELVEGDTLAERIARGPLPLVEALTIARQIIAALEAAHEHGVVHRDLKPSNIKLRADGTVKLLDFGLAQVSYSQLAGADPTAVTVTAAGPAIDGVVMGTPAYMSPEQARGLPVDKRTDIWSFGCVLYEMLTARPAFGGDRVSDVVARIIEREPDLTALPADVPANVRRVLQRCLHKDPRERLRDIGDARQELEEESHAGSKRPLRWAAAAIVGLAIALVLIDLVLRPRQQAPTQAAPLHLTRYSIPLTANPSPSGRSLAISPDGGRIAIVTDQGLMVRAREELDAVRFGVLSGAGSGAPFFSPDGQWIAFNDGQALRRMPSTGGPPVKMTDTGPAVIGSWASSGIVFADMNGLFEVAPDGGQPRKLPANLGPNEQAMFPQLVRQGQAVLFTVIPSRTNTPALFANAPGARVEVLELSSGARHTVVQGGGRAQYLPTGHLVYVAGDTLYAAAFDLKTLQLRGDAVPVQRGMDTGEFAISEEGTLVYQPGIRSSGSALVWVDRQGVEQPLDAPLRPYIYPRLSPDGTRVALDVAGPPSRDIWIWDLTRKTFERFTLDPAGNPLPVWTHDGRRLAFGSDRFGVTNLFWQAADGSGEAERLLESARIEIPISMAPDGRLLFSVDVPGNGRDVHALTLDASRHVERILYSAANELNAEVSPDGHWILYDSDESGQYEVYVRPYPQAYSGGRWQISVNGGRQPMWSHNGQEIFYRDFEGGLQAAAVEISPTFKPGQVTRLFPNKGYAGAGMYGGARTFDVSQDGRRFLMLKQQQPGSGATASSVVVVLNWFEELKRAVPGAQ